MNKDDMDLLRATLQKEKDGKVILVEPPAYAVKLLEDVCERTGLSWKQRHCYLMNRGKKWNVELSIDGFRLIANSDPEYNGQAGPFWTMGPDLPWTDIPPDKPPYAAKVGIYRKGQAEPTWGVAKFKDYEAGPMWKKFGSTMVAKCAEMLGLRKALPGKLGGLYGAEEMAQATKSVDVEKAPNVVTPVRNLMVAEHEGIAPDDEETFTAKITNAKTLDELKAIGADIQKSHLGLQVKTSLSVKYGAAKAEMARKKEMGA